MQETELLEGAEELEKLERQVRSSASRLPHDWRPLGERLSSRSSGAHDAEEPLLGR